MRVFTIKWFRRFAQKEGIADDKLCEAANRAQWGSIDAVLGGELIKQRIARPGRGKSAGFRTVIAYRAGSRSIFLYGFAKSERDNIEEDDLLDLRRTGKALLALSDVDVELAIRSGELWEVDCDERQVS